MRELFGFLALSVSISVFVACGPSSTTSTQSAQPAAAPAAALDPCSVITKAEVEQVLSKPVGEGKLNAINKSVCEFSLDEMGSAISFMLVARSPQDSVDKLVAEMNKRKIHAEPLAGLGDGAYRAESYGMRQAGAYKGLKHVIVTVAAPAMAPDQAQTIADKALRKALERL